MWLNRQHDWIIPARGFSPRTQRAEILVFTFVYFEPFLTTEALAKVAFVCFVVKKNFFNSSN